MTDKKKEPLTTIAFPLEPPYGDLIFPDVPVGESKDNYYIYQKAKRQRGRPAGTVKHKEKKTKTLHLQLSPMAHQWAKDQGRGWLADWIETQAELTNQAERITQIIDEQRQAELTNVIERMTQNVDEQS